MNPNHEKVDLAVRSAMDKARSIIQKPRANGVNALRRAREMERVKAERIVIIICKTGT